MLHVSTHLGHIQAKKLYKNTQKQLGIVRS